MASHRNPLIVAGGRASGGALRVGLDASDDVGAYAIDRRSVALFPRTRENMRENTRSMGAARHSGARVCGRGEASREDFSRLVETESTDVGVKFSAGRCAETGRALSLR